MSKEIEFTPYHRNFEHDAKEQMSLCWWLEKNLGEGCLEDRLKKVSTLISIIGHDWLASHPQRIGEVAYSIGCRGRDHEIK